jgi:hypothetical protein
MITQNGQILYYIISSSAGYAKVHSAHPSSSADTLYSPKIYDRRESIFLLHWSALYSSGTAKVVFYTAYILQQKLKETENIFLPHTIKINTVHKYIWTGAIYFSSTHFGPVPTSSRRPQSTDQYRTLWQNAALQGCGSVLLCKWWMSWLQIHSYPVQAILLGLRNAWIGRHYDPSECQESLPQLHSVTSSAMLLCETQIPNEITNVHIQLHLPTALTCYRQFGTNIQQSDTYCSISVYRCK